MRTTTLAAPRAEEAVENVEFLAQQLFNEESRRSGPMVRAAYVLVAASGIAFWLYLIGSF
jgi:hypothetical protein